MVHGFCLPFFRPTPPLTVRLMHAAAPNDPVRRPQFIVSEWHGLARIKVSEGWKGKRRQQGEGRVGRRSLAKKPATRPTAIRAMKRAVVGREGGWEGRAGAILSAPLSAPPLLSARCHCPILKPSLSLPPSLPSFIAQRLLKQNCLGSVLGILFARLCFCKTVLAYHSFCDTFLHLLLPELFRRISLILSFEQRLASFLTHVQFI